MKISSFCFSSVIYANRHHLEIYRMYHPERLAKFVEKGPTIVCRFDIE